MSSTNRNAVRNKNDYYITPINQIELFWEHFTKHNYINLYDSVLDPSAGGDPEHPIMPYPSVLQSHFNHPIKTIDIREDSIAEIKGNYLDLTMDKKYNIIVANPPFNLAIDFIKKALNDVAIDGYVIMLLRLNFFGSEKRYNFLKDNMPEECYVHSKRMGFIPEQPNKTDSIEYAHFVWRNRHNRDYSTNLRIIR